MSQLFTIYILQYQRRSKTRLSENNSLQQLVKLGAHRTIWVTIQINRGSLFQAVGPTTGKRTALHCCRVGKWDHQITVLYTFSSVHSIFLSLLPRHTVRWCPKLFPWPFFNFSFLLDTCK